MSNPTTDPHAVCPECHTHQPVDPDGRLKAHMVDYTDPRPGSGDYPNRALGQSRYDVTSQHASCPAATGQSQCTHFPDGAHRCGQPRDHFQTDARTAAERTHRCTCGSEWSSLTGSVGKLFTTVLKPSETLTARLITEYVDDDPCPPWCGVGGPKCTSSRHVQMTPKD
jgi:hypothetical protein